MPDNYVCSLITDGDTARAKNGKQKPSCLRTPTHQSPDSTGHGDRQDWALTGSSHRAEGQVNTLREQTARTAPPCDYVPLSITSLSFSWTFHDGCSSERDLCGVCCFVFRRLLLDVVTPDCVLWLGERERERDRQTYIETERGGETDRQTDREIGSQEDHRQIQRQRDKFIVTAESTKTRS